jgi:hypothetical protein
MQKKGTGRTRLDDGMVAISKNDTPRVKKMLGL